MNTMVLGGCGFLGGAIAEELLARGREVVILDVAGSQKECDERFGAGAVKFIEGDILDADLLFDSVAGVDEIYHFAGVLGTSELDNTPKLAAQINIVGALNVFDAAVARGVPRVFHASKPDIWPNAYSITKHAAERLAALYAGSGAGTRICSLRYFNAFGPRQARGPVRKLVPTFVDQALHGEPLEIYGDGSQSVDLIFVYDLARITVRLLEAECSTNGCFAPDCGRGVSITVNEVARAINSAVGNRAGVRHVPMRRGEVEGTALVADTGPLMAMIPDVRFTDFGVALNSTIEWYSSHDAAQIAVR